ncbi:unnamed protein product [Gordionus sp. m RMFG-2023]
MCKARKDYKLPPLTDFLLSRKKAIFNYKSNGMELVNLIDIHYLKSLFNDPLLKWIYDICVQKLNKTSKISTKSFSNEVIKNFMNDHKKLIKHNKIKDWQPNSTDQESRNFDRILKNKYKISETGSYPLETTKQLKVKNVLTLMAQNSGGPLDYLNDLLMKSYKKYISNMYRNDLNSYENSKDISPKRMRILTRSHTYIRGYCDGYLEAFDKHWNIVLCDVDEFYIIPIKNIRKNTQLNSHKLNSQDIEYVQKLSHCNFNSNMTNMISALNISQPKNKIYKGGCNTNILYRRRHLSKLFLRGDNIVLICKSPYY